MNSQKLIICDLDGTLADCRHRQHLAAAGDWDGFHALMHKDPPVAATLQFLTEATFTLNWGLVFLTGRPEIFRSTTVKWLQDVCQLDEDMYLDLLMRPKDDWTSDVKLKPELLRDSIEHGAIGDWLEEDQEAQETLLFLEDRDKVVAMWRDLGYTCWQVAEGAF